MELAFSYNDKIIPFKVIYRKRKNITITVEPPNIVTAFVPQRLKQEVIIAQVTSKANWIVKKLEEFKDTTDVSLKKQFIEGELFLYLGREYYLQLVTNANVAKPWVNLVNDKLQLNCTPNNEGVVQNYLEKWYRKQATEEINKRVIFFQKIINCYPQKITIKTQKKRWGSCSSNGNLNFNWRIVMAPESILDYLVVHEMCHLIHLNHSRDFWNLVATFLPNYKEERDWLKKNGHRLNW